MRAFGAADLLALWERGAGWHALDRSALLCAWARPELPAEAVRDLPLGDVAASLLRLHEANFGARVRCRVDCPGCGERLELTLAPAELLQPAGLEPCEVEVAGLRLRPPALRDLAAIADERDVGRAARRLLARCAMDAQGDPATWPDDAVRRAEDALESIDPNADLGFDVRCEACGEHVTAQLDPGSLLWDRLDARARALLGEVHRLARAYGWSEGEILALGDARRAAYLSMVDA